MMKHKQNYMYSNKVSCKIHSNTYGNHHNYSCSHLRNHLYKWHCMKSCMNLGMWPNKMPYMPWNNCCNFPSEYSYKCCCSWLYILLYNWNRSFQSKYLHIQYHSFHCNRYCIRRYKYQCTMKNNSHCKCPSSRYRSQLRRLRHIQWNSCYCNRLCRHWSNWRIH